MLALMDSRELSGWLVLMDVQHKEREAAEEHARHVAESGDGQVVYHGRRPDDEDDEVDEPDGTPE